MLLVQVSRLVEHLSKHLPILTSSETFLAGSLAATGPYAISRAKLWLVLRMPITIVFRLRLDIDFVDLMEDLAHLILGLMIMHS